MTTRKSGKPPAWLLSPLLLGAAAAAQVASAQGTLSREGETVVVHTRTDTLRLTACGPAVVHVVAGPEGSAAAAAPKQPWLTQPCSPSKLTLVAPKEADAGEAASPKEAVFDSGSVQVRISLDTGHLLFTNERGERLLQEFQISPRTYQPVVANGESLYRVADRFYPHVREGLYGLGQHQNGVFNYRGAVIPLAQANTDVAIPLLLSTQGYGLLWNTAAESAFDNRFPREMKLSAEAAHAIDYYFPGVSSEFE